MNQILVLQTTRMGDMIQTTPLVRALRRKYPGARIVAMVRDMSCAICEMDPDIDEVRVYNEDSMFLHLRSDDSQRLVRAYEEAEETIAWIRAQGFDVAYNCTNSVSSAMLLKLAQVPKVVGADMSDDWQFVLRGRWVNYFFTSVFHRDYNDLNLCDISSRFAGDAEPPRELVLDVPDDARQKVHEILGPETASEGPIVCFQLGASEEAKRWSVSHFAALGRRLVDEQGARLYLVGVKSEALLGEAFEKEAPGIATPLYGKTNLFELAALLDKADMLVTNDTGTMHVAAAVKCPVVLVSVGYVHFRETGPYGEGHCAIERRREKLGRSDIGEAEGSEADRITPEQVLCAIEVLQKAGSATPFEQLADAERLADVDLYYTRFAPDGCLQWYPAIRRPLLESDFTRIAYRSMWLDYLKAAPDSRSARESLALLLSTYETSDREAAQWAHNQGKDYSDLAEMAQQGMRTTEKLIGILDKKAGMARAKAVVTDLVRLDEQMRILGELRPHCRPLTAIARFERDNLEGLDPNELAGITLQIYRDCFARARLMAKKVALLAELATR